MGLATNWGLWLFEAGEKKFYPFKIPGYESALVRELVLADQQLWIATNNEIWKRSPSGKMERKFGQPFEIVDGIGTMVMDRFGNLWMAGNNGVGWLDFKRDETLPFYQINSPSPQQDNFFFRVMQDSLGGFWFRMFRNGLGYCPVLGGEFEILLQHDPVHSNEEIKNFCTDVDGHVWVMTLTHGLYLFPKGQKKGRSIDLGDSLKIALANALITDRIDDRLLWFSSKFGLCSFNRFTYQRKWYRPKGDLAWLYSDGVGQIEQDGEGNIWCVMYRQNKMIVGHFDKIKGKFVASENETTHPTKDKIFQLKKVAEDKIWAATNQGVIVIDTKRKTQNLLNTDNGFPVKKVLSITPDIYGNVWFTSDHKFCKFDGAAYSCYNANKEIGTFVHTSSTLTNDGMVVFGGSKGLHVFDSAKIEKDTIRPKVYLSGFRVFGKEKHLGKALESVRGITLPYDENAFSLEFTAPLFLHNEAVRYQYKLEGFDKDWIETDRDERRIPYSNLKPGRYFFKVKAANADGFWTYEKEELNIELVILPPWYHTWWAYLFYALSAASLLIGIRRYELRRHLAQAEARHFKELDTVKTRLYTNITHEFRTPLTVILGMADLMKLEIEKLGNFPISQFLISNVRLIRRNGKQLLNLVNQMLDLSKLESGQMKLHLILGDIVGFIHYLSESFHSYADSKDIRLHFSSDYKELNMDYDPEKMQHIMTNLLSNAIKFTPAGGDVYIQLMSGRSQPNVGDKKITVQRTETAQPEEHLLLVVKDNGQGIPAEHLPHIFDRFYQVDASATRRGEGTGIGLALTKELVKLMDGEILVESETLAQAGNPGTKFTIVLPITRQAAPAAGPIVETSSFPAAESMDASGESTGQPLEVPHSDLPLVLIVEDNPDVITYLSSFLSNNYQLVTATNGQGGIDKALELVPDLIVSDVMMPEKDGFEVCETLKKDERTSHIPLILLTAKSDPAAKLEGLTHGADAYLAKPFNKEELLVRMEKLIELRRRLQKRFDKFRKFAKSEPSNPEELFLQKLITIVEDNLADEHFGLPSLCKKAGLSRSQLFRKLKALTGKSTTHFIRSIRLAKGKELLESTDMTVSEVAYEVGFSNVAYFSTMFREEFGMPPSEVRKG